MKISKIKVGYNERPKIIAEIGINHEGSLDIAKKMAELAISNGADIIKTQLHLPSYEMSHEAKKVIPQHTKKSIFAIMEDCSLSIDEEYEFKNFVENSGSTYLCTPFSSKAAEILGQFNVSAFKVGSGECNNPQVLNEISKYKKPTIISTGMNNLESVKRTNKFVKELKMEVVFMHTTNLYPTPYELVRLGAIKNLQELVGNDSVGLSDHTTSNLACLGAVSLGAVLLERHFTDSKERIGPDIVNSMDPKELKNLRKESELMFKMRGGDKLTDIKEEDDTRNFAFATVVCTSNIRAGEEITFKNTWPKRPGIGQINAWEHQKIVGMKAARNLLKEEHIKWEDLTKKL